MKVSFPLAATALNASDFAELVDDLLDLDGNEAAELNRVAKELGRKPLVGGLYAQSDMGVFYQNVANGPRACITSKHYGEGQFSRSPYTVFVDEGNDVIPDKPRNLQRFNDYASAKAAWVALV